MAVRLRPIRVNGKFAIELEVTDTGIGIDKERLDEAFQPFVQLSDSNTRNHRGLGLGLALVRRNAKSLGATLDLKSKPTQGTCVKVRFPQCARA